MGSGMCPDCNHAVSAHVDEGCTDCDCGHDYSKSAKRAREEGCDDVTYVREMGYESESECQDCGETFDDCSCDKDSSSNSAEDDE